MTKRGGDLIEHPRAGLCALGCLIALTASVASSQALAQDEASPPAVGSARVWIQRVSMAQADLLAQWLDAQASQQRTERRFTGGALLAVGAAGFGFGTALMLQGSPNNEISKGGGVALIAVGAFGLGLGIHRLVVKSEAEEVARRYHEARGAGADAPTVARFEGEFYAAAQHARKIQNLTRWLGVATALAGIVVLTTTPFADLSSGGAAAGYVGGGLLVLGGGINIASSLATPPPVKAWKAYQQGEPPEPQARRLWGLVPSMRRSYVGLSWVGQI